MRVDFDGNGWDFTPAISLIHSFSLNGQNDNGHNEAHEDLKHVSDRRLHSSSSDKVGGLGGNLGDFATIWKYLGCPADPLHENGNVKGVRWRDELDGADLADNDEKENCNGFSTLTKQQRKKLRRQERRSLQAAAKSPEKVTQPNDSNEDEDYDGVAELSRQQRKKLRRRERQALSAAARNEDTTSKDAKTESAKENRDYKELSAVEKKEAQKRWSKERGESLEKAVAVGNLASDSSKDGSGGENNERLVLVGLSRTQRKIAWRKGLDASTSQGATLYSSDEILENEIGDRYVLAGLTKKQRKKARRRAHIKLLKTSSTNGGAAVPEVSDSELEAEKKESRTPNRKLIIHNMLDRPLPSDDEARTGISMLKRPILEAKPPPSSEKIAYARAAAKKAQLTTMLHTKFQTERPYMKGSRLHTLPNPLNPEGIHIFIDASNILIGFHDALKMARSLPFAHRIKRQTLSFHSLSLILTRGRPTAKRVVVGSDNLPEMAEAKLIGYETCILDRVHKAKELTPRQRRFANPKSNSNPNGNNAKNGSASAQSAGSGSETTAAVPPPPQQQQLFAPEKWVEQAVDEILHLKMMESVVDAAEPSTMVLATGDAAAAEYSGGFLMMVERALGKGWRVELTCWRRNCSWAYRRKEFRERWGERFKIVELDDFVEVLLVSEGLAGVA